MVMNMFLFGKKKRLLIEFASQLAEGFYNRVPQKTLQIYMSGKSKSANKQFGRAMDDAVRQVAQFKAKNRPGVYGKAKLHQVFAERLMELGYPKEVAEEINHSILIKTP
jgi:hypothetical protein